MKIIIPMSGTGNRFIKAGYTTPKPLIEVDSKPIIEHVVNLFPGETDHIFICNDEHIAQTRMKSILQTISPHGQIISIPKHKNGPVYAISKIFDLIDDNEEVIVNYCDFSTYWDYQSFLQHTRSREADGAIPSYKGFHPHMLGSTNYAFIKEKKQWMIAIKEKEPWTNNRMKEYASNGTYYFKNGKYIKKYFQQLMNKNININGEYYVSLVYNLMKQDGLKTSIYEVQHMLQWGTPQDIEEYQQWSNYFTNVIKNNKKQKLVNDTRTLIPMAGRGKRFSECGYTTPKPLLPISGKPMIVQAAKSLPETNNYIFICLQQHLTKYPKIKQTLKNSFANAKIVTINKVTEGQACTAELGITKHDLDKPLLIGSCDNGIICNETNLLNLINDPTVDAVVWSFKNHPASKHNPHMYGWIYSDKQNNVKSISVKKPISDSPEKDHAIVGTFYFSSAQLFIKATHELYKHNIRINNEFYIDSCIDVLAKLGYNVKIFEVDYYICWGTPDDYKTFEYWQSFFHKCWWHPYSLEKDPTIASTAIFELNRKYRNFKQKYRKKLSQNTLYATQINN